MSISLLTPSVGYKPFRYPWAYDYWLLQQQVHWLPEEVPLGKDIQQWHKELSEVERSLLTHIFRLFTESDKEVNDNYMDKYAQVFKPTEVKMMLAAFSNIETVHIAAYSHLLDTVGIPESEYEAFLKYKAMKDKSDFLHTFNVDTPLEMALTLAVFAAFVEGLQLFASFAMLMNFPRFNKMTGMGQIISWSIRDESLHCEGMIRLFKQFCLETFGPVYPPELVQAIINSMHHIIELEDAFIDQAFELGPVEGMTPEDIKKYIRFTADWRLEQLGLAPVFNIGKHPLPWLPPLINGQEHANFFEQRATEYSKGATQGEWGAVWDIFDGLD